MRILVDDLGGPADPFHPTPDSGLEGPGLHRTTPQYWIGTYPTTGTLTATTSWTHIGLHPTSFTLALGPSPFPTTFGSDAHR